MSDQSGLANFSRTDSDRTFRFLRGAARIYCRAYHTVRAKSPCPLPAAGPAILVCNHISSIDPIVLQTFTPRLIRWMMAREYFEHQPMKWVFEKVGVILVDRASRDLGATRAAMRVLEQGYVLGVFPEGRIETTPGILPFQSGIGLLATKTKAPVFPAYLDGNHRGLNMVQPFFKRSTISVSFAPQALLNDLPDNKTGVLEATQRIESAVRALQT